MAVCQHRQHLADSANARQFDGCAGCVQSQGDPGARGDVVRDIRMRPVVDRGPLVHTKSKNAHRSDKCQLKTAEFHRIVRM